MHMCRQQAALTFCCTFLICLLGLLLLLMLVSFHLRLKPSSSGSKTFPTTKQLLQSILVMLFFRSIEGTSTCVCCSMAVLRVLGCSRTPQGPQAWGFGSPLGMLAVHPTMPQVYDTRGVSLLLLKKASRMETVDGGHVPAVAGRHRPS